MSVDPSTILVIILIIYYFILYTYIEEILNRAALRVAGSATPISRRGPAATGRREEKYNQKIFRRNMIVSAIAAGQGASGPGRNNRES